jgi:hypothetical protein
MSTGAEIIAQAVLWNPASRTYGAPDLLIRSDVLRRLFPRDIDEAAVAAASLTIAALIAAWRLAHCAAQSGPHRRLARGATFAFGIAVLCGGSKRAIGQRPEQAAAS